MSQRTFGRNPRQWIRRTPLFLLLGAAFAQAAPQGGVVVAGSGSIANSGSVTTVTQNSPTLGLSWKSFNVGVPEMVNFVQPSTSAIAVNRILDTQGSQILGRVNANGQVYLINPNGILFGPGAQVNVGGLVASTLDLNDASLGSARRTFSGSGSGRIVNQGTLTANDGGYIALLGQQVSNQGTLTARLGTVAMGAGNAVTLNFSGDSLVGLQVDKSTLDNLAENKQLIQADGGQVIIAAGAANSLLASVVNNSGKIAARTVENRNGTLTLSGSRAYDASTTVAGSVLTAAGVAGETFAISGTGNASNLASKNVQTGSTLATLTGLSLGASANGGLSGNYNALSTTGSSVDITNAVG